MVCRYVKLSRTTVICAVVIAVLKKKQPKNKNQKPKTQTGRQLGI